MSAPSSSAPKKSWKPGPERLRKMQLQRLRDKPLREDLKSKAERAALLRDVMEK